jgi:hypothetical protein
MCSLKFKPLDAKFDSYLPKEAGLRRDPIAQPPVVDEIRVLLSWNPTAKKVDRLFGQNPCTADPAGDEKLRTLIKDSYTEYKSHGKQNVPAILDVGPKVPWTSVVDVLDICRSAGVQNLEFGAGTQLEK